MFLVRTVVESLMSIEEIFKLFCPWPVIAHTRWHVLLFTKDHVNLFHTILFNVDVLTDY